jgi:choline dehydrogenase-like flavoprotein
MGKVAGTDLRMDRVETIIVVDAIVFPNSLGAQLQQATHALAERTENLIAVLSMNS